MLRCDNLQNVASLLFMPMLGGLSGLVLLSLGQFQLVHLLGETEKGLQSIPDVTMIENLRQTAVITTRAKFKTLQLIGFT